MSSVRKTVQVVARRMGLDPDTNREQLELRIAALLYLILKTGRGRPDLVKWVAFHLPNVALGARFGDSTNADKIAHRLGRLLCSQLLRQVRLRYARLQQV